MDNPDKKVGNQDIAIKLLESLWPHKMLDTWGDEEHENCRKIIEILDSKDHQYALETEKLKDKCDHYIEAAANFEMDLYSAKKTIEKLQAEITRLREENNK